jgi:polyribonucleotide nucleotidyltransferase
MNQHNFSIHSKSVDICGKKITFETGKMAKQANGAVMVTCGKTSILCTAVMGKLGNEMTDFFPLTVDYIEKMYAAGKISSGFIKRETKPSTQAILYSRLIDRVIRPMFPDGFRNPVHVVVSTLSYDGIHDPGILAITGVSAALSISDIPFHGPVAGVTVGIVDGQFIVNPSVEELSTSTLDLNVGGNETSIVMIEAGASEVSEESMLDAIYHGHEYIKTLCQAQVEFAQMVAKPKIEVMLDKIPSEILDSMDSAFGQQIKDAMLIKGKLERQNAIDTLGEKILSETSEKYTPEDLVKNTRYIKLAIEELVKKYVRNTILYDHNRADGRGIDDIRPISIEVDLLPIVHGSALFTRGETQALGAVTLGTADDEQIVDGMDLEYKKAFYLHYNFPPFSVGEAGFMRAPGRRDLGHGALAERALETLIPSKEAFPYTIRIVSEILESNGSSSMASVCIGSLALMAAGVPIKSHIAGIANGLIMEGDKFVVLTDIQGLEDHLGDMDFKVAGTRAGITAMQMDIKVRGITKEIMTTALAKAKDSRFTILDYMYEVIPEHRKELPENAPRIETIQIDPTKLGEVIGSSGKVIKAIIEETKVDINIEDSGHIQIASSNAAAIERAKELIYSIVTVPDPNEWYQGVISRIEPFGVFVKFMNGYKEGMAHISQLPVPRGEQISDHFIVGNQIRVRVIESDRPGKIALTTRDFGYVPPPSNRPAYDRPRRPDNYGRPMDNKRRY